jgi:putative acetyltransferase
LIDLIRTTSENPDFVSLVDRLNFLLAEINGAQHSYYSQFNAIEGLANVVVAYTVGQPIACGAFRPLDDGRVEIKRMFVEPSFRGQGVGGFILRELEAWAGELGATKTTLETSKRLLSAVSLYQRSGYVVIPNYGQYVGMSDSVCMEKPLPVR